MSNILSLKFEFWRKVVHTFSVLIPILYFFLDKNDMITCMFVFFTLMLIIEFLRRNNKFFNKYMFVILQPLVRPYESRNFMSGTYLVAISLLVVIIVPEELKYIVILSISYASVCDAIAAIFGLNFGKIILFNDKTLEGTAAFIISGLIITFIYLCVSPELFLRSNLFLVMLCPFISGTVELSTKMKYDNVTVPLFSAIYLLLTATL